jgi:hypothetical protein
VAVLSQVTSKRTLQCVQVTDAPAAIVRSSVRPSENVRVTTLSASDWEGVTVEDFNRLYRLLCSQYKDFHKCHCSSEHTIQGLEGEIKSLRSRNEQLEGEIEELKVLDDEELKKLAKTEEVQVLEANMYVLESQLDFERGQWTKLQGKYKELMDRFFVLDHWEGVSLANAI